MPRHPLSHPIGVVAAVLATLTATGCAGAAMASPSSRTVSASAVAAVSAAAKVTTTAAKPSADRRTPAQRAEDTFIAITASHLCTVQSTVYDNPKAMAAAYNKVPAYPGLTAKQVADFRARMTKDKAFAARVYAKLQATCKPGSH